MVSYEPSRVIRVIPEILSALPLTLWILVMTVLLGELIRFLTSFMHKYREKLAFLKSQKVMFLF